ncbi:MULTISPECIES: A24 family peptidase [unclassified Enterococcus]|uniref:prepilin peptidase n=1 Tax=unclassified Enterococcus TaxID=2608891 RepID=UPI0013EACC8D|nr:MULTISPECIES: A24 family peptidase [unclassified Enterococcus]
MLLYFIIGSCVGSFLFLTAQRLPQGHSIIHPSSHCVNCNHFLSWYELIPVLSIIVLRFRCRHCRCPLSPLYLVTEICFGGFFVWFFVWFPERSFTVLIWLLSAWLLALMDVLYLLVEAKILYASWLVLWLLWWVSGCFQWQNMLVASMIGCLLACCSRVYLGTGDILLLICWSGGLPFVSFVQLLFTASFFGVCFFLIYSLRYKEKLEKLPFIPFLSVALLMILSQQKEQVCLF